MNKFIIILAIFLLIIPLSYSIPIYVSLDISGTTWDDIGNVLSGVTISIIPPNDCSLASGSGTTQSGITGDYELQATYACSNYPATFTLNATKYGAYQSKTISVSEPGQYSFSKDFQLDVTPPTITFSPNSNDWDNQLSVTISAVDNSNIKELDYTVIQSNLNCPSMSVSSNYNSVSADSKTVTISSNGNWKICAYAIDQYNNIGYLTSSGTYHIDTQLPTISTSITNGINKGSYICVNNGVSVSFTANDQESGLQNIKFKYGNSQIYNKDLNGQKSFSDSFSFSISNNNYLYGIPLDRAGNSYSDSISLKLDNKGPNSITLTKYPQYVQPNKNYQIKWNTVSDVGCAGLKEYKIDITDPNGNKATYTTTNNYFSFNPKKNGNYKFSIAGVDNLDNIGKWASINIISDGNAPTVSFNPNSHSWTKNNIQTTISASDDNSGVSKIYYKVIQSSSNCPAVGSSSYNSVSSNSKTVTISSNGNWKICAYAKDKSGNVPSSATKSGSYKFDKVLPTISITSPQNGVYINQTPITVTWTGSDSLSGIKQYEYKVNSGSWHTTTSTSHNFNLNDGAYTIYVKAIDKAGNSKTTNVQFIVDTTAPVITFDPNNSNWVQQKSVTISFSDTNSIVDKKYKIINSSDSCGTDLSTYNEYVSKINLIQNGELKICAHAKDIVDKKYKVINSSDSCGTDLSTYNEYTSKIDLTQNGELKICAYAKDIAGNAIFSESGIYKIDNQKPSVGDAKSNLPFYNGFYYSKNGMPVKVFAEASDSLSGIKKCYYVTNNNQIEANFNGTHCVYNYIESSSSETKFWFKVVDNAGNSNSGNSAVIKKDNQKPIVSISTNKYWNTIPVIIKYNMSDNVLITKYNVIIDLIPHEYYLNKPSASGIYIIDPISNGNHTVKFEVHDIVDNVETKSINFCFDNQKPDLNLETPIVNGKKVTFKWDTNDNGCAGINYSELYLDSKLIYSGKNTQYTIDVTPGNHIWKVVTYDNANNKIEKNSTVYINDKAPKVTIISPVEKYLNSNSVVLKFKATDDKSTNLNCTVTLNNTKIWSGSISNNTEKDISTTEDDGNYTWKVICNDDVGNSGDNGSWFVIDTQKPFIDIITPISDSYINHTNVDVKFNVSDNNYDYTNVSIWNGTKLIDSVITNKKGIVDVTLNVNEDGNYKIIAESFDKAGNSNYDEVNNIVVDTTSPITQINSTTSSGNYDFNWTNQTVYIKLNSIDQNPYKIYYKVDSNAWKEYKDEFNISDSGNHTLKYYSIDKAGNKENTKEVHILIDKEEPNISFIPNSQDDWINHDLKVNITAQDQLSGIKEIFYSVIQNGQTCPPVGDSHYISSTNNPTAVTLNSDSRICAYTIDNAGNSKFSESGRYKIDEVSPTINITNPTNNSYTQDTTIWINWTGSSDIIDYKVDIDGSTVDVGTSTSYKAFFGEGNHNVKVIGIDKAGNQNESEIILHVDYTAPTVNITSPSNNSVHSGNSITVSWNANDNMGIDHFDIYLNNVLVDSTNKTSEELDSLNDGKYVVKVIAIDKAGNQNESETTFYIDNEPPVIDFISPMGWTNENPTIVFNVSDIEPNITCVVKMDGNKIYDKKVNPGEIEIPLLNVLGGNHSLNITCADSFYKSNITKTIKVDNDTPVLNIVSPSNNARIPIGSFVLTIKASDNYSGIKNVTVIFGNKEYKALYDGRNYKITLSSSTTGTKSIIIKANDNVGHQTSTGMNVKLYKPTTTGGGYTGGTGCTVVGYSCNSNSDCCTGYCSAAGVCANHPKDVNLSIKVTPTSWEMYDNETAKFTILVENNGKDMADGIKLSLSGINGTLSQSTLDLNGKTSKIIYLTAKEGLGEYTGKISATWNNVSDSATFSLRVLDHSIPVESKLAADICSNASAHIVNLASSGMNVSKLYKEYNKAMDEIKDGNYSNAKTICQKIINTNKTITPPTKVTPFFIRVGNGIKDNWDYITVASALIVGIVAWIKREAIIKWYELRKLH